MNLIAEESQEIEIVYGSSSSSSSGPLPTVDISCSIGTSAETQSDKRTIMSSSNKSLKENNTSQSETDGPLTESGPIHSPLTTPCETPRSSNISENDIGTKQNGAKSESVDVPTSSNGNSNKDKEEELKAQYEEHTSKEISRRLVEYFVVVSSVPKVKKNKDSIVDNNKSSPKPAEYVRRTSNQSQQSSSQLANDRVDVRRVHLGRDYSGGSGSVAASCSTPVGIIAGGDCKHPSSPNNKSPTIPTSPSPTTTTIDSILGVLGEPSPAERKSIAKLQQTDQMISDQCLEIGGTLFSDSEKSTSATKSTSTSNSTSGAGSNSLKNNFIKSMNEQKKKIQANTEKMAEQKKKLNKMNASGIQNLEKKLEGLNLDKTLLKFKSMKFLSPTNSSLTEHQEKGDDTVNLAIHPSSSSDSSFSIDGRVESTNNNNTEQRPSAESTFRPSNNPTSARITPPGNPLLPTIPPPPPERSVSSPLSDGRALPRIDPLPDRQSTPRGASENIRFGHKDEPRDDICNREYSDIDDILLEPVITAQYPPVDHPDQPLNPMLPQFCHPHGSDVIVSHEYKMPTVHHFVLTDAKGAKLYGTCLTVYEEFAPHDSDIDIMSGEEEDDDVDDNSKDEGQERGFVECSIDQSPKPGRLRRRSKNHKYYAPRVLCLLSTWPYLSAFRTYLTQLYRLATTTNLMTAPLERYILNICSEVPAPPPGSFEVRISILDSNIRFWAPPADQPIPYVSLHYGVLFECLDIGNVLFAWYTLACERKILLVSSQLSLLTVCAEILCSMLFPMRWSHLYIPCLPRFLTPMLDAPMPYLIGISRENFPHAVRDISDETVVVDLDRNVITMGRHTPDLPFLPYRRKMKLEAALEKYAGDVFWKARGLTSSQIESARISGDENLLSKMLGMADAVWDEHICTMDDAFNLALAPDSMSLLHSGDENGVNAGQSRWDAVQEAFLRFYCSMLKDYSKYMPSTQSDQQSSWRGSGAMDDGRFRTSEFVQNQPPDFQPFLDELTMTQQFDDFVTRRMYNAGDAPDIKFFDQSIDAKRNRSKLKLKKKDTPFLHSANAHRNLKQIDAIEPNQANLPPRSRFDTTYDMKKGLYTYPTWPESLDGSLFGKPRPIPKIITAEFDRRSALASMLRAKHGSVEEGRLSGSNNPSPEATAFVLFFVTFSNTIGKEWSTLEKRNKAMGKNMLDQCHDESSLDSSISDGGKWIPKVNPPWMANDKSFQSLHCALSPPTQMETENAVHDDSPTNDCCAPDCTNFCGGVGKAIDPSTFIGNPWATRISGEDETTGQMNANWTKSPSQEELENEIEKAHAIAKAQVDLGFNTLKMMRLRKLPTESITYKTLIEACGRCGIAHRAQQLMEMMTQDGLALDSEVYYAFINAFSNADTEDLPSPSRVTEDTASEFSANKSNLSATSSTLSFLNSSQGEIEPSMKSSMTKNSSTKFIDGFQNAMSSTIAANRRAFKAAKMKQKKRLKQNLTKAKNLCVTDAIKTHLELSHCILEDLYPGIKVDTDSDTCPKCSQTCSQDKIILGWTPCQVKDFSTTCPSCKHRFVPKFSISCDLETFEGSQGMGTPLYCDYLSPWVLLREIRGIITTSIGGKAAKILGVEHNNIEQLGIDGIIDPAFREGSGINATLWWNMIVTFRRFKIPYTFLLQGSYNDQQLIMPSMTDTMM